MNNSLDYPVLPESAARSFVNEHQYRSLYEHSIQDPDNFWAQQAQQFISWSAPWKTVLSGSFDQQDVNWFAGGRLNACFNCLDRHLEKHADKIAVIWEGDNSEDIRRITYAELHQEVCRLANVLKSYGVTKGDRIGIYLPMIPEAIVAMLACARLGAIHAVVFAGFSADALKMRILDTDMRVMITADGGFRGGKTIPVKQNVDKALEECPGVKTVLVVKRTGDKKIAWHSHRDKWYQKEMHRVNTDCPPVEMESNDPLFILYTSGSTGKPKGILHSTGGYLVYAAVTHHYVFDYHPEDIYWCTADIGWITGHSYLVYGPLANAATVLMFEGSPFYPTFSRFWEIIDRHKVSIFYTAPTAIRALRREGDLWVNNSSRKSLKLIGTVGEPINPDVWQWYHRTVGDQCCPIVDTWWQTETGGIMITPFPGATPLEPGAASWPFFGVQPVIVDDNGQEITDGKAGSLVIKKPWPGLMLTVYNDPKRYADYFQQVPGGYFTGDGARCDAQGYYWIAGRNDDVINVSGHRIGSEELESAFLKNPAVSEVAVVAVPHEIKGEGIYAFVTLKQEVRPTEELRRQLIQQVRISIGSIAAPEVVQWARDLPKTRSGKIMRRILRRIAGNEIDEIGDISTLANPEVVKDLIAGR